MRIRRRASAPRQRAAQLTRSRVDKPADVPLRLKPTPVGLAKQPDDVHSSTKRDSKMTTLSRWPQHGLVATLAAVFAACGGGGSDSAAPAVVATVEILETGALLQAVGETRQLSAVARDAQGNVLDVPMAWSSGKATVVGVDAAGKLTATSGAGSSQVVASAQGVRSPPLLVVVAQPAVGSVPVTDAQVLGEPVETDPNAAPGLAETYHVTLTGVAPPALGTLLVGTGSKAVAGRVVAVDNSVPAQVKVTLAVVPLAELFPTLQLDEVFDLSAAPVIYPDAVLAHYTVERVGNTHTFTPKATVSQDTRRERPLAGAVGTRELGPFNCNDRAVTGLVGDPPPLPVQLTAPPVISITISPSLDIRWGDGVKRFVVKAEPMLKFASEVKASIAFEGKVTCKGEFLIFPIPVGGVFSFALSGLVPVGAGFEFGGKITLASIKLTSNVEAGAKAEIGLICPPAVACGLHTLLDSVPLKYDPKLTLPSGGLGDLRLESALEVFGTVDAVIGNRFLRRFRWEMLKTRFGGKLEGSFARPAAQIADMDYKSNYKLSLEGKAGVGVDIEGALAALGLASFTPLELTLSTDLATSPAAAVTADRATFNVGDTVNLKAVLEPSTFLGLYNVERIEWVHKVGTTQTTIATQPASSGQTEFVHALTATTADSAGDYYAFVVTKLPELPLELDKVSLTEAEAQPPMLFCPLYEVDVGGRTGNSPSRVFNVNAEAGFSVPGAYGGASLGGNLTLSLTSGFAGTSLAKGEVTYLVEMDTPNGPVGSTWRWSVRSNVGVGGSCRATLSVGGVTRSITATTNDLQLLEIPLTLRHGDVLKATLDASCSSPGLLPGPPEILVNANIGSTIDMMGIPGGRLRAVMCIP
jgi:hypothetical protein